MALNYRSFGFQVLVGMVAGLLLGLVARQMGAGPDGDLNWLATALKTLGAIFVSLLKAVVPPLVFAAIVASIALLFLIGLPVGRRLCLVQIFRPEQWKMRAGRLPRLQDGAGASC